MKHTDISWLLKVWQMHLFHDTMTAINRQDINTCAPTYIDVMFEITSWQKQTKAIIIMPQAALPGRNRFNRQQQKYGTLSHRKSSFIKSMTYNTQLEWALLTHDDVTKWRQFPRYWPFVCGIPMNSHHKGQWRGSLIFSLTWAWINDWVNNRDTGDLRCHRAHYDVTAMRQALNSYPTFIPSIPLNDGHSDIYHSACSSL